VLPGFVVGRTVAGVKVTGGEMDRSVVGAFPQDLLVLRKGIDDVAFLLEQDRVVDARVDEFGVRQQSEFIVVERMRWLACFTVSDGEVVIGVRKGRVGRDGFGVAGNGGRKFTLLLECDAFGEIRLGFCAVAGL